MSKQTNTKVIVLLFIVFCNSCWSVKKKKNGIDNNICLSVQDSTEYRKLKMFQMLDDSCYCILKKMNVDLKIIDKSYNEHIPVEFIYQNLYCLNKLPAKYWYYFIPFPIDYTASFDTLKIQIPGLNGGFNQKLILQEGLYIFPRSGTQRTVDDSLWRRF